MMKPLVRIVHTDGHVVESRHYFLYGRQNLRVEA